MAQLLVPVYENQAAYLMHLAALAFALGLIAEIAFRGISTAFVVGWESTWFAQNPEAVKTFIDWTYGLIPFGGDLPDASTLEAMQSDRLVFRMHPVNAAPWLIRMMVLLTVFVIIPRLFLALISFSAARFWRIWVPWSSSPTKPSRARTKRPWINSRFFGAIPSRL